MKKNTLMLGTAIALLILLVPVVHADVDDRAPFWHEWLAKIGFFSVTGYTGTTEDKYCASTYNCVKTDTGYYRYDCYNSGLSPTSCLCSTNMDATKAGCSSTTTTTTTTSAGSCNLGAGGTLASGASKCMGIIKFSCTNGVTSSKIDSSCGTIVQNTATGAVTSCPTPPNNGQMMYCSGNVLTAWSAYECKYKTNDCSAAGLTCQSTGLSYAPVQCLSASGDCTYSGQTISKGSSKCVGTVKALCSSVGVLSVDSTDATCNPTLNPNLKPSITDAQITDINGGVTTANDEQKLFHDTLCGSKTECQSNQCLPADKIGLKLSGLTGWGTSVWQFLTGNPGFCYAGTPNTATSNLKSSITDDKIAKLNAGTYIPADGMAALRDSTCDSSSDCTSKSCEPASSIGVGVDARLKYGWLGWSSQLCYGGSACTSNTDCTGAGQTCDATSKTCKTPTTTTCSVDKDCSSDGSKTCVNNACVAGLAVAVKPISLTYQEWKETSTAQRFNTLCKLNTDCAPYDDVSGTGKDYSVACNSASTRGILQTDVDEFCKSSGTDKYWAVGAAPLGFLAGCAGGAWATTITVAPSAAAIAAAAAASVVGAPVAAVATVAIPISALAGCIIGGSAISVTSLAAIEGLHNTLVIDCKNKALPKDVGACIAKPKGGLGLDSLTTEYPIFGVSLPLWAILGLGFILLMAILSAMKK